MSPRWSGANIGLAIGLCRASQAGNFSAALILRTECL